MNEFCGKPASLDGNDRAKIDRLIAWRHRLVEAATRQAKQDIANDYVRIVVRVDPHDNESTDTGTAYVPLQQLYVNDALLQQTVLESVVEKGLPFLWNASVAFEYRDSVQQYCFTVHLTDDQANVRMLCGGGDLCFAVVDNALTIYATDATSKVADRLIDDFLCLKTHMMLKEFKVVAETIDKCSLPSPSFSFGNQK